MGKFPIFQPNYTYYSTFSSIFRVCVGFSSMICFPLHLYFRVRFSDHISVFNYTFSGLRLISLGGLVFSTTVSPLITVGRGSYSTPTLNSTNIYQYISTQGIVIWSLYILRTFIGISLTNQYLYLINVTVSHSHTHLLNYNTPNSPLLGYKRFLSTKTPGPLNTWSTHSCCLAPSAVASHKSTLINSLTQFTFQIIKYTNL